MPRDPKHVVCPHCGSKVPYADTACPDCQGDLTAARQEALDHLRKREAIGTRSLRLGCLGLIVTGAIAALICTQIGMSAAGTRATSILSAILAGLAVSFYPIYRSARPPKPGEAVGELTCVKCEDAVSFSADQRGALARCPSCNHLNRVPRS